MNLLPKCLSELKLQKLLHSFQPARTLNLRNSFRTSRVVRLSPIFLALPALLVALLLPLEAQMRLEVILVAGLGTLYMVLIETPFLADQKSIADATPLLVSIGNTLMITLAVTLFGAATPLLASFYLVSIAAMASRHGLGFALWTAFLSTVGYLAAFTLAGIIPLHIPDSAALIGIFFLIALLTGSVSEAARRHTQELEAERAVVSAVSQTLDLQRVLDLALDQALTTLRANAGAIYLADDTQTELTAAVIRHPSQEYATHWQHYHFGEGITGQSAALRQAILVPNLDQDPRVSQERRELPRLISQISVPLIAQDRVVGVLNVNGYEPHQFSEMDAALLRTIAASVAVAIDHARVFNTLEQRVAERTRELSTLYTIDRATSQSLKLEEVLDGALDKTLEVLGVETGGIYLLEPDGKTMMLRVYRGISDESVVRELQRLQVGEGVAGIAAAEKKPIVVDLADYPTKHLAFALGGAGFQTLASTPLISGGKVIGALSMGTRRPRAFPPEELDLLTAIGQQLGGVVQNARLYTQTQQNLARITNLYELSSEILSTTSVEETASVVARKVVEATGAHSAIINLMCTDGQCTLHIGMDAQGSLPPEPPPRPNGTTMSIVRTGQVLIVTDLTARAAPIIPRLTEMGIKAFIGLPLKVGARSTGVLFVRYREPHSFSADEIQSLTIYANQAATAIDKARLFFEIRHKMQQLQVLNEVGRIVSSTMESNRLLDLIHEQLSRIIPADTYFVTLADCERQVRTIALLVDEGERFPPRELPLEEGMAGHVIKSHAPLLIRDVERDTHQLGITPALVGKPRMSKSWLGVPMMTAEHLVGVLAVGSYQPNMFDESDQEILQSVATQAAIALDNARLFSESQRKMKQLAVLNEVGRIVSSTIEIEQLLELIYAQLSRIIAADTYFVTLADFERRVQTLAMMVDEGERFPAQEIPLDDGLAATVIKRRAPLLIRNLEKEGPQMGVRGIVVGKPRPAQSWLGVPMITAEHLVGTLAVASYQLSAFDESDLEILQSVGTQAAIVIDNARHHAEVEDQARRDSLTQVLNHGTFIAELHTAYEDVQERGESFAMIMLDLDNFKRCNDVYGHVVGDTVLKATVQAIRAHVKSTDLVGRWGGEEFAIALPGATIHDAEQVAERIRTTLVSMKIDDQHNCAISAPTSSQGIAAAPQSAHTIDELIDQADRALYRAKARGRDQIAEAD